MIAPLPHTRWPVGPRGFSLVELLVAMTLGLFLIAGMLAVFAGNKRSSELNSAMANMQESARYAIDQIAGDLRMAGFQGCPSLSGGSVKVKAVDVPMDNPGRGFLDTAVFGSVVASATNWAPMPPFGADFSVPDAVPSVPGTHALAVQFGDAQTGRLRGNSPSVASRTGAIRLEGSELSSELQAGDLAIISDCIGGEIFEVTQSIVGSAGHLNLQHKAGANDSGAFEAAYGENGTLDEVRVMPFRADLYFVGDTGLDNENGDSITSLYKQSYPFDDPANPPTELVQGVENLRLSFGVRGAGQSLQYVQPGDPAFSVEDVRSVRIGLLMSSWERIADEDDDAIYMLAGQAIGPAGTGASALDGATHPRDRRFRLAFNTTVKIRNMREDGSR